MGTITEKVVIKKENICDYFNEDTEYCGNPKRRTDDLRYAFGAMLPDVICDYSQNHDKMNYCPYSRVQEREVKY